MVVPIQRQTSVMVEVSGLSESQTSPILTGKMKIKSLSVIQEKKSNLMTYQILNSIAQMIFKTILFQELKQINFYQEIV